MSNSDVPLEVSANTPPDWDNHPTDLLCPLCKYNLRHLTVARCPECGFTFSWQELLDAEKNKHKYVFEHGKDHNFKSFWRTYWRTCQPRRFWSDLNPAQPVMLFRLMVYWVITAGVVALCFSGLKINSLVSMARANMAARAALTPVPSIPGCYSSSFPGWTGVILTTAQVDAQWPPPWQLNFWKREVFFPPYYGSSGWNDPTGFGWAVIFLIWPWLTMIALLVFRFSMRQAKILRVHLLRTVLYSCDFGFLLGTILLTGIAGELYLAEGWILVAGALVCSLITTYRLTIAFRQYLRVHLPFATVLVSQLIALLVIFLLLIQIADFSRRI